MTKFDPKKYRKNCIREKVNGYPGISQIWVWNKLKNIYEPPKFGKPYLARKGKARQAVTFATKEDAFAYTQGEAIHIRFDGEWSSELARLNLSIQGLQRFVDGNLQPSLITD